MREACVFLDIHISRIFYFLENYPQINSDEHG